MEKKKEVKEAAAKCASAKKDEKVKKPSARAKGAEKEIGLDDIGSEMRILGSQLKNLFSQAAQSEQAQKVKAQVAEGVNVVSDNVGKFVKAAKEGDLEQDLKKGMGQFVDGVNTLAGHIDNFVKTAREGDLGKNVKKGVDQAGEVIDKLSDGFDTFVKAAKEGDIERSVKKNLYDSIKAMNEKLFSYTESQDEEKDSKKK